MAKPAIIDLTLDSDDEDAARMDKQRTAAQTQAAAKSQTDARREGCSTTSKAPEAIHSSEFITTSDQRRKIKVLYDADNSRKCRRGSPTLVHDGHMWTSLNPIT